MRDAVIIVVTMILGIPAALLFVILLQMAFNRWVIMTPTEYQRWRQDPDWPFI